MSKKNAVILLSGGLDSSTVLAYAKNQGFCCYAISFDYGSRQVIELTAAQRVAAALAVTQHQIIKLDPNMFAPSALTHEKVAVPDYEDSKEIPVTYVPARNTIFLSIALGYAENIEAQDIFYGASHVDYSGYPDCRPEFVKAFEHLANVATKAAISGTPYHIHAPLMELSKAQTIALGQSLGVDYSLTVSCYQPDATTGAACGRCDSCTYRRKGFEQAGVPDPTLYQSNKALEKSTRVGS